MFRVLKQRPPTCRRAPNTGCAAPPPWRKPLLSIRSLQPDLSGYGPPPTLTPKGARGNRQAHPTPHRRPSHEPIANTPDFRDAIPAHRIQASTPRRPCRTRTDDNTSANEAVKFNDSRNRAATEDCPLHNHPTSPLRFTALLAGLRDVYGQIDQWPRVPRALVESEKTAHLQGQFQVVQKRQFVAFVIYDWILCRCWAVDIVPHAATDIFFVVVISRDWNDIRKVVAHSLFAIIEELLKLRYGFRRRINNEWIRVLASVPVGMGSTKIDAANLFPELGEGVRYGANLAFDSVDALIHCRLWTGQHSFWASEVIAVSRQLVDENGQRRGDAVNS